MASFFVENFGCRATQADGAAIERQFRDRGLRRATSPASAELVVLNTCTVTAAADQDARAAIRRIRRQNPSCEIIVTGCYAQRAPQEIAALPGVARVIGNSHKHRLAEIALSAKAGGRAATPAAFIPLSSLTPAETENRDARTVSSDYRCEIFVSDIFAHSELLAAPVFEASAQGAHNARTRPNLKVQDGCDNRCSFCVIPSVRGHSRSLPAGEVIAQVNALVAAGYREVVISGINLGRWGRDLKQGGLPLRSARSRFSRPFEDLIRSILEETSLEKLRLSSIEPMDWTDELIRLIAASSRIARHAHVPLQSGSDRILRLMRRKYRPWHYREKIEKIHAALPAAAIGADVMVGFPGESDTDFEATCSLIAELPFTYLHVFTYSSRPGTPSAVMPHQVPVEVARQRNRILRELAAKKSHAFMRSFVGKALEAITLNSTDLPSQPSCGSACTEALTDNYLKLRLPGSHTPNRWIGTHITAVEDGMLLGNAIQPS